MHADTSNNPMRGGSNRTDWLGHVQPDIKLGIKVYASKEVSGRSIA
jgi:hypothetical protein